MESILSTRTDEPSAVHASHGRSAASWGAIVAGAVIAASVSLILLALGAGLGFAEVSPWQWRSVTATSFAVSTAIWWIVMQWLSAGLGGYIAGRMRTRWIGTRTHEVFFRDTAHGFVTWSVATLLVASVLAGSVSALIGGGVSAASTATAGSMSSVVAVNSATSPSYNIDKMFRTAGDSSSGTADYRGEATRILVNAIATGRLSQADRVYLATLVAQRTGISRDEAEKRVDDTMASAMDAQAKAKQTADAVRKAAAEATIFTALSMLIGAFIASVAAAFGGHLRDEHP
jgi:hypothetical protein